MTDERYFKLLSEYQERALVSAGSLEEIEQQAHEEAWDQALAFHLSLHQAILNQAESAELNGVSFADFRAELVSWFK